MTCKSARKYFSNGPPSRRDTVGSKVVFTRGFQPSSFAILRKHTPHSHLVSKLCKFHGSRYQGTQGEEVSEREGGGINRVTSRSLVLLYE